MRLSSAVGSVEQAKRLVGVRGDHHLVEIGALPSRSAMVTPVRLR